MDSQEQVVEQFYMLAKDAERFDAAHLDESAELYFEAVLSHISAHPTDRPAFARAFIELAYDPAKAPPELIQFCMHELRWPEVKSDLEVGLASERSERVRHILQKLLMSFDDNWYDADLYDRFAVVDET